MKRVIILYYICCRPKSKEANSAAMMEHEKTALKKAVDDRYANLGPITFFEMVFYCDISVFYNQLKYYIN